MKYLLSLFVLLNLSSCQEGWGDHFLSFAQNDFGQLSLRHAESNLRQKWIRTFNEGREKLLMRLAILETSLCVQEISDKDAANLKEEELFQESIHLVNLQKLRIQLILESEELEQAIIELRKSCESRGLFRDLNLSEVERANILSVAAPEQSKEYMISTDFVATAVNAIAGLWGGNEYKKQKEKFNNGVNTAMAEIPSEDKLFELSKGICITERKYYIQDFSILKERIEGFKQSVYKWKKLISARKQEIDYYLIPDLVERVSKKYNFGDFYSYVSLQKYKIEFDRDLDRVLPEIYALEDNVKNSNDQLDKLIHKEKLIDQSHNLLAQLDYFINNERRKNVLASLKFLKNKVQEVLKRWEGDK